MQGGPSAPPACLFGFPDSGQNCSKSERLRAQLRALPGTDAPYESSCSREPGKCAGGLGMGFPVTGGRFCSFWAVQV